MVKFNKHILVFVTALSAITMTAREKQGVVKRTTNTQKVMAGCSAPQASAELTVNNVRTIIFSGSDMWWDLFGSTDAWYAVPKVNDKSKFVNSNFAGNVWFGGIDGGNNLRLAAQTYRQDGIDFWTGPLSTVDATTTSDICAKYDKIFKMTRKEVDDFVGTGTISQAIRDWPGNGDLSLNQDQLLAPFKDVDNDNIYNPEAGDYPYYDVFNNEGKDNAGVCKARLFGDETLWWVYNDNGDVHQATGGKPIGMEIRAQAFAFKTTDDINNMTFYNYQLINRASTPLYQTYMTVWTDADLGCYQDDYIGCDVQRGLGFIYNADGFDENCGSNGYGEFIPALGCDFFQGPVNTTDGVDNDNDGLTDEPGEQMGMSKFLYYNNNIGAFLPPMINPDNAQQYYNYMTGYWKDGTPFTCDAANAYGGSIQTSFVFPGTTYSNSPCGPANWEESATPLDRRFLQSSGPFTLLPGAVNYVTVGLPWARTSSSGSPKESVKLLKVADDKAQALFDNCFKVLSGPEAPDMTIQELSNELIIYFSNKPSSNNYLNNYKELDPSIIVDTTHYYPVDKYYHFEGFKVYQLKNESVTQEELTDASKAKLVFQCDVNNGIKRLVNYEYDANVGGDVAKVKVEGKDNGIQSTFHFTQDEFSTSSDKKVVNNKTYYFYCVAYGYNQFGEYKEDTPWSALNFPSSEGQKKPYLEGRKSKKAYGIPHMADPEKEGTISNSFYGYGPKITRIEGQGNGGNNLSLTQNSINDILNSNGRVSTITYENGRGPINVKVVDPLNVPNSNFSFKFINRNWSSNQDTVESDPCRSSAYHKQFAYPQLKLSNTTQAKILADSATWVLTDITNNKEYYPCKSIKIGEEFYFSDLGLSINIGQVRDVADLPGRSVETADLISGSISFANSTQLWLGGLSDRDGAGAFNWIRAGSGGDPNDPPQADHETNATDGFADPTAVFEGILGGTWAPYALTAAAKTGTNPVLAAPGFSASTTTSGDKLILGSNYDLRALASVQIIITSDKSKWTKALVLEECDEAVSSESGFGRKLEPRRRTSVDKQGIPLGAPGCNTAEATLDSIPGTPYMTGLSWFPGYAINLETGERLNIAFGEDSYQSDANQLNPNHGADMMWNPTSTVYQNNYFAFGGRHYIYVFGNNRSTSTYSNIPAPFTSVNGRHVGVGNYNTSSLTDMVQQYKLAATYLASSNIVERTRATGLMNNIWSEAMWVNIPLLMNDRYAFTNPASIPCDVAVDLKVRKPYRYGLSGSYNSTVTSLSSVANPLMFAAATTTANITRDTVATQVNNNFGYYTFNTADIFTELNNADRAKSALDLINVVPNPYYAYSTYEQNRVDNRVRITNLPNKCKIKIFTLNGTLVRTFDRDVSGQEDVVLQTKSEFNYAKRTPYQDWDLKNQNGITVASGLYIIHIDVPGVGEKILKWFGVMRPLDLQSY